MANDPVLAALGVIRAAAAGLRSPGLASRSDEMAREGVRQACEIAAVVESARLALIADLDSRPGAVPGAPSGRTAATYLIHAAHLSSGQARRDVEAAHALDPGNGCLPQLGAALAEGRVQRGHVDAAVRTMTRIPKRLLAATDPQTGESNGVWLDAFFTRQSQEAGPVATDHLARQVLQVLRPEAAEDRYDPDAYDRRRLEAGLDWTGMTILRGQLDPASGAIVRAALDYFGKPGSAGPAEGEAGQLVLVPDERTAAQRRHDALVAVAATAMAAVGETGAPLAGGLPVHVAVDATPEMVAEARAAMPADDGACEPPDDALHGLASHRDAAKRLSAGSATVHGIGPVTPGTFGRFLCEAILTPVARSENGAVLHLGRSTRLASPAQRRALAIRDAGCSIPGCPAPASGCEAHHVRWWRHDGETNITNLALVCHRHHTAVHARIWTLVMRDGVPWAIPPRWVDPLRRPLRNRTHEATSEARQRCHRMRLDLDDDG